MALRGLSLLRKNCTRTWSQWKRQASSIAEKMAAEEQHANASMVTWKRISLFVAIPVSGYLFWKNVIMGEEEEHSGEHIHWPHLRIRRKPFPWGDGDTTLFHNPHNSYTPDKPEKPKPRWTPLEKFWLDYLHEDPDERDEFKWKHLAKMQKRKETYLKKKAAAIDVEVPRQAMDLVGEMKRRGRNPKYSGIDN